MCDVEYVLYVLACVLTTQSPIPSGTLYWTPFTLSYLPPPPPPSGNPQTAVCVCTFVCLTAWLLSVFYVTYE